MKYELDPRLLPPSGASVQCTRCSFVFTALPSGEVVIPNNDAAETLPGPSARGEASRGSSSSTTRIFGSNPYLQQQEAERSAAATPQATKAVGTGSRPARVPVAKPGTGYAQAGGPEDANSTLIYGSRGNPPGEEAPAARTPATGSASVGSLAPSPGKTQAFGVAAARPPPSSASTTQVFGAVSLPPAPSASTTQVFGAVSLPATKPPSPSTTQVFGASSIPTAAPKSAATTTQVFGSGAVRAAAEKAAGRSGSSGGAQDDSVPWMAEPAAPPSAPRGVTAERRSAGSSSGPIPWPPEAPVALPPPTPVPLPPHVSGSMPVSAHISVPVSLPPEPVPERGGVTGPSRRLPAFEPAPGVFDRIEREDSSREPAPGGGKERLLVVLAAVVVLGLTIWLTYPMWRSRGSGLPPEAQRAKEEAVALLRRDDEASREQAFARLRPLVSQFPSYTEAQAELGVAIALKLDDIRVELELLGVQEKRLVKEIQKMTRAQAPADWENRVNVATEELETLGKQRQPLEAAVVDLTKQLEVSQQFIRAAPETEPAADVVARLKAQAVQAGVTGNSQALTLAERLRKVENPAQWSAISLAEYGLNGNSPPASLAELSQSLQEVRERDSTFIRAYVLGARLALRQQDPATARTLLDTVEALNPNHTLARKLRAWATTSAAAP